MSSPYFARIVFPLGAVVVATILGCSRDGDNRPSSTPPPIQPPPGEVTGLLPEPTPAPPPAREPLEPGPPSGTPCPVDASICDFANRLLPVLRAGNIGAFIAMSEPVPDICRFAGGVGGPSQELCRGAAVNETRFGYWVCSGECTLVTESEFRDDLERWFQAIVAASGSDAYGPGDLRVASVACARQDTEPSGSCSRDLLRVYFTFIPGEVQSRFDQVGIPGQRMTVSVSLHRGLRGELWADSFGWSDAGLKPLTLPARERNGEMVTFEFYPWTP